MNISENVATIKYYCSKIATIVLGDVFISKIKYLFLHHKILNLDEPETLNEKLFCLKLRYNQRIHAIVSDKYACREWLSERYGTEYLIPLLYYSDDYTTISRKSIPNIPCVIKSNNGSGTVCIIRDPEKADWNSIQKKCKVWLKRNYYYLGQERQYKDIKPYIVVEQLLLDSKGKIPNDYKLTYLNGTLVFVYCSIDREGQNYRKIYSPEWEPLPFVWVSKGYDRLHFEGPDIDAPKSFDKMKEIGADIAKLFPYVRVDFYDVDGKLYYGEVTLCHGSGNDLILPVEYDYLYGSQLII